MKTQSPCITCGACCCYYRVSFHWMECDPEGLTGPLPQRTVPRDHHQVCMKGTKSYPVRCIELSGEVGGSISCNAYLVRASPCRNFGVQMQEDGSWTISNTDLIYCNEARAHFSLPPLIPEQPLLVLEPTPGFEPPAPKAA
ncbi:MAG: YkgJ family cysteine cluster protein [Deltaproteobacteria bacterium]|nr:YkgJ family cysteine cluster protein [Deltaproteobacteria bacterium]